MISSLASIDWHRFLDRPRLPVSPPSVCDSFREERILITGAGGSIGSALAQRLASLLPRALVLVDVSAQRLTALERLLAARFPAPEATFLLGNVADPAFIARIVGAHSPTTILHAAAEKHVGPLEERAFAAVQTNIFGTAELIAGAMAPGHPGILLLSTDKAVHPGSVMGATKYVAEQLVRSAGGSVLRLGNVLASRDSVVEIFARQLATGDALTVATPAARRYFLTLGEAVDLLLAASRAAGKSALFVPDLRRQYLIADLASFLTDELAPGRRPAIAFSRLGPGDKESEQLWSGDEHAGMADQHGLVPILSPVWSAAHAAAALTALRTAFASRDLGSLVAVFGDLVPGYTPSQTVLRLAAESSPRLAS